MGESHYVSLVVIGEDGVLVTDPSGVAELQKMNLLHAVNAHSDDTSVRIVDENAAFMEDLFMLVGGAVQKAMQEGGPMQVMMNMATWPQELKLPQYAEWKGYDEHLPTHVRRMALSIFHGG